MAEQLNMFAVKSRRIRDIKTQEGDTIETLRAMLARNGYDVKDAAVTVRRYGNPRPLVGRVSSYKLKEGDCVEFLTDDVDFPMLRDEIAKVQAAHEAAAHEKAPEAPAADKEAAHAKGVQVEQNGKTLVIRITL